MLWMARRGTVVLIVVIGLLLPALAVMQYRWMGEISRLEQVRAKTNIDAAAQRFSTEFDEMLAGVYSIYHSQLPAGRGLANDPAPAADHAVRPQVAKQVLVISRDGRDGFTVRELDAAGRPGQTVPWPAWIDAATERHVGRRRGRAAAARAAADAARRGAGTGRAARQPARRVDRRRPRSAAHRRRRAAGDARRVPRRRRAGELRRAGQPRGRAAAGALPVGPRARSRSVRRLGQPDAGVRHPQPRPRSGDRAGADARRRGASVAAVHQARGRLARGSGRRGAAPQPVDRRRRADAAGAQRRAAGAVGPPGRARRPAVARAGRPHLARAAHAALDHHLRRREPRRQRRRQHRGHPAVRPDHPAGGTAPAQDDRRHPALLPAADPGRRGAQSAADAGRRRDRPRRRRQPRRGRWPGRRSSATSIRACRW